MPIPDDCYVKGFHLKESDFLVQDGNVILKSGTLYKMEVNSDLDNVCIDKLIDVIRSTHQPQGSIDIKKVDFVG